MEIRSRLGRVGIVSPSFLPGAGFVQAPAGENRFARAQVGARKGVVDTIKGGGTVGAMTGGFAGALAEKGFLGAGSAGYLGAGVGMVAGAIPGYIVGIALTPVGALVGGISGAITAVPQEVVRKLESQIGNAMRESTIIKNKGLRKQVIKLVLKKPHHLLFPVEEKDFPSPDNEDSYSRLKEKGLDSAVEISVVRVHLSMAVQESGEIEPDPLMILSTTARARLIRTRDGKTLYEHSVTEHSNPRLFTEWGKNEGRAVSEEIKQTHHRFAKIIFDEIFKGRH